eukprot:10984189-Alexandrium_andersonii.AAC.1
MGGRRSPQLVGPHPRSFTAIGSVGCMHTFLDGPPDEDTPSTGDCGGTHRSSGQLSTAMGASGGYAYQWPPPQTSRAGDGPPPHRLYTAATSLCSTMGPYVQRHKFTARYREA